MRYLSVCSGIEAATVAWHPLGWAPAAFSEIEAFPRAVLAHHYPQVPCHGDFTTIGADDYGPIDLLVGGTPCQSFSIAGLRGGLADDRGNLALEFLRLADRKRPRWLVWENVPGVLSSNGGRDFGSILGGLVELGYGFAYRVLDAQHFGVPQRRRRVFVAGHLGDWRRAGAVLFERQSLSRDFAPRREGEAPIAGTLAAGAHLGGFNGQDAYNGQLIPYSIMPMNSGKDYVARAVHVAQPVMASGPVGGNQGGDFIACRVSGNNGAWDTGDRTDALTSAHDGAAQHLLAGRRGVRKMTPLEWERLQGFPDGYTAIPYRGKPAADGPRYKALGNSMAVPVMRWIGERIARVDALGPEQDLAA